jgi:hypothetical protein
MVVIGPAEKCKCRQPTKVGPDKKCIHCKREVYDTPGLYWLNLNFPCRLDQRGHWILLDNR